MKTAQDTIREALDQGSLCSNVAYNLGQHREDSEQILGTVRKFDELRLAALASLKSLDGQEVAAWMRPNDHDCIPAAMKDAPGSGSHTIPLVRQSNQPSVPRLSVEDVMAIVEPLCLGGATAKTIRERLTKASKP